MERLDEPWNNDYVWEAISIAKSIIEQDGYKWTADNNVGRNRRETRVAMRALMIARGELGLRDLDDAWKWKIRS